MMAGATDVDADKEKRAWMRDDTRKRSAGGHMAYSENTSCRTQSMPGIKQYYYSGFLSEIRGSIEN